LLTKPMDFLRTSMVPGIKLFNALLLSGLLVSLVEAAPTSEIKQPAHKATVAVPVVITGTFESLLPLDRIDLLIRNSLGEFWNGAVFQSSWIAVHPVVNGGDWSYTMSHSPSGDMTVTILFVVIPGYHR